MNFRSQNEIIEHSFDNYAGIIILFFKINRLKAFCQVVEDGSIVEAASKLHLSASAVSRLITGLKADIDLTLFHRTRRRLVATDAAQDLYREVVRILGSLDEFPEIVTEIKSRSVERLRIVAMPRTAPGLVSSALVSFREAYPDTPCYIDVLSRHDFERWVATTRYDVGIGTYPVPHPAVENQPIYQVRAGVLLRTDDPLAQNTTIDAAALKNQRLITLFPDLLMRQESDDILQQAGIELVPHLETVSSLLAVQFVRDGLGITITDPIVARTVRDPDLVFLPLEPERWWQFGAILPSDRPASPRVIEFLTSIRKTILHLNKTDPYCRDMVQLLE